MQKKPKSTGRVWDCEFRTDSFRPEPLADEGRLFEAVLFAARHTRTIFREMLFLAGGTTTMWAIPSLRKELLPDDPKGRLIGLFSGAYRRILLERAFRGTRSAIPYCYTGALAHCGHGFCYLPDQLIRGNAGQEHDTNPIVFLHGYGGNLLWNIWALKTEFPDRIILAPSGGMAWLERYDRYCLEYIDEMRAHVETTFGIELERPWLMALSQGGPTGFSVASHAPDRFRGFVSIASSAVGVSQLQYPPDFPILMINGTDDLRVPYSDAVSTFESLQSRGGNILLEKMEGANHFFFLSQREEMARVIREFWRKEALGSCNKAPPKAPQTKQLTIAQADCRGSPAILDCLQTAGHTSTRGGSDPRRLASEASPS